MNVTDSVSPSTPETWIQKFEKMFLTHKAVLGVCFTAKETSDCNEELQRSQRVSSPGPLVPHVGIAADIDRIVRNHTQIWSIETQVVSTIQRGPDINLVFWFPRRPGNIPR